MRLSLNKNSLKQQRDHLAMYRRFLPSLDLKRQQLLTEQKKAQQQLAEAETEIKELTDSLTGLMEPLGAYAIELTGLVTTAALVRPSKSVMDLEARSVKKKWKDKRFAAKVDRSIIQKGVDMLDVELGELITDTIMGMREVAAEIGLQGEA